MHKDFIRRNPTRRMLKNTEKLRGFIEKQKRNLKKP